MEVIRRLCRWLANELLKTLSFPIRKTWDWVLAMACDNSREKIPKTLEKTVTLRHWAAFYIITNPLGSDS